MNILIIGTGFSGAIIARELAEANYRVTIIDKRDHIAGNAYDFINEYGITIHKYGPHLFHTSNEKVVAWLSKFTEWIPYRHKVKALLSTGQLVTLPVNQETIDIVGQDNLLDTFFRPYTRKMWGVDLEMLDPAILNRVPVRNDLNEEYFPNDTFQALPKNGYTQLIKNILSHVNILIKLDTCFNKDMESEYDHIFNSMAIDEYFDYLYGKLPYRSIKFHTQTLPIPHIYPVATVNFTHQEPYTRVTEWKNLPNHGQNSCYTTLTVEEPCSYEDNNYERYYPVKDLDGKNRDLYFNYKKLIPEKVTFIGRCGLYAYLNMDQAINTALTTVTKFIKAKE